MSEEFIASVFRSRRSHYPSVTDEQIASESGRIAESIRKHFAIGEECTRALFYRITAQEREWGYDYRV